MRPALALVLWLVAGAAWAEPPVCEPGPPIGSVPSRLGECPGGCVSDGVCWTRPETYCREECVEYGDDSKWLECVIHLGTDCELPTCLKRVRFCGELIPEPAKP